ncbi:MAG: DUF2277 domain-containing protein [Bryobacteraceae bacterium]
MCRSIKRLRNPERISTETEIRSAALQFVRKVSGFHKPSRANEAAFARAVEEIAFSTERLLAGLPALKAAGESKAAPAADAGP